MGESDAKTLPVLSGLFPQFPPVCPVDDSKLSLFVVGSVIRYESGVQAVFNEATGQWDWHNHQPSDLARSQGTTAKDPAITAVNLTDDTALQIPPPTGANQTKPNPTDWQVTDSGHTVSLTTALRLTIIYSVGRIMAGAASGNPLDAVVADLETMLHSGAIPQ